MVYCVFICSFISSILFFHSRSFIRFDVRSKYIECLNVLQIRRLKIKLKKKKRKRQKRKTTKENRKETLNNCMTRMVCCSNVNTVLDTTVFSHRHSFKQKLKIKVEWTAQRNWNQSHNKINRKRKKISFRKSNNKRQKTTAHTIHTGMKFAVSITTTIKEQHNQWTVTDRTVIITNLTKHCAFEILIIFRREKEWKKWRIDLIEIVMRCPNHLVHLRHSNLIHFYRLMNILSMIFQ